MRTGAGRTHAATLGADGRRCAAAAGSSGKNAGTVENCTFQVTDHGRSDPPFSHLLRIRPGRVT